MRYALTSSEQGLILVDRYGQKPPLRIDYTSKSFNQRRRHLTPKHEQLIKAVNQKPGATVLDMTAGLGFDAFILASYGHQVVMIERSKVVYLLVKDALKRAALVEELIPTVSRMQLLLGDSTQQAWQEQKFDVAGSTQCLTPRKNRRYPSDLCRCYKRF